MTPEQEKFVLGVIKGLSYAQAYREAHPNTKMKDDAIYSTASAMINGTGNYRENNKVHIRFLELKKQAKKEIDKAAKKTIADAQEILEIFTEILRNKKEDTKDRIKCGELLGKRFALFAEQLNITNEKPLVIVDDLK